MDAINAWFTTFIAKVDLLYLTDVIGIIAFAFAEIASVKDGEIVVILFATLFVICVFSPFVLFTYLFYIFFKK